jgi:hypothetical protein
VVVVLLGLWRYSIAHYVNVNERGRPMTSKNSLAKVDCSGERLRVLKHILH